MDREMGNKTEFEKRNGRDMGNEMKFEKRNGRNRETRRDKKHFSTKKLEKIGEKEGGKQQQKNRNKNPRKYKEFRNKILTRYWKMLKTKTRFWEMLKTGKRKKNKVFSNVTISRFKSKNKVSVQA